jgi:predicted house-cleaning noncanonical NTP pyrophosphatase (MazG superfamily)
MRKEYDKLVRDRIPEIIEADGKDCQVRQVDVSEFREYAFKKLREEIEEFIENPCALEAADVMEIMNFICYRMGIREQAILAEATAKRVRNGGFEMGFILDWVDDE